MRGAGLVLVSALLLAGCASERAPYPEPRSDDEIEAMLEKDRAWIFDHYPDLEKPDVEFERWLTEAERQPVLNECLDAFGGNASVGGDGAISWSASSLEEERQNVVAIYSCTVRFPDPVFHEWSLTEQEREALYDYSRDVLSPCLRSAGYEVPSLPRRDEYTAGPTAWNAYELTGTWPSDFEKLRLQNVMLRCPEFPVGWHER